MYSRKKDRSQAYVIYDQKLENKLKTELKLSKALDKAIAKEQLRLVFQPIMDAQSESIVAAEALLRWNLDGESIPPDVFIPIAEQSGAIREIGHWVLDQSIRFSKLLEAQGHLLKICVNVSIAQFEDPGFVDAVKSLIVQHGVNPERIYLELTESVFSRDKLTLVTAVKRLQALGLHVSIDDFGTGYSSLSIIHDLNVNIVKVDRSFVNNLEENGLAVVRAVMVMAQGLGYKVVAEGVEKAEQADVLRELGVDLLQGFLYSKPLECDDLIASLRDINKAAV
jgi:EAL domain-containing protein (putative c-di-GMP-specific phosphodiesterase class I)